LHIGHNPLSVRLHLIVHRLVFRKVFLRYSRSEGVLPTRNGYRAWGFLEDENPGDRGLYNAGCFFSLASAAVAKDGALPQQVERCQRAEEYAARAVSFLSQARDAGFFKDRAKIALKKQNSDLDPLRARADFRNLAAELEGQAATKAQEN
jgi:hypothetical protein